MSMNPEEELPYGSDSDYAQQLQSAVSTGEYSEEQVVEATSRALVCKQEPMNRLDASTLIAFVSLKHVTREDNLSAGALLLEIVDLHTGEVVEQWLPKKLCANLCMDTYTVYVWTPFLKGKYPQLIPDDEVE